MCKNAPEHRTTNGGSELLRAADVAKMLSVSVRSVWRLRDGCPGFPRPIRLNGNLIRWRSSDIEQFVRSAKDA